MESKLKYLFLLVLSCGNDHLRGQSDYHFIASERNRYPKFEIKLKKVSSNNFFITQLQESTSDSVQANSKGDVSLNLELNDEGGDTKKVIFEKDVTVKTSNGEEFNIKIIFTRKFQLMNFNIGIVKIYHLQNISTDIPDADVKTNCKNKILYNTYRGENVVEIEY